MFVCVDTKPFVANLRIINPCEIFNILDIENKKLQFRYSGGHFTIILLITHEY